MKHQADPGEQAGPFRRGFADDGRQRRIDLQALDQRHEATTDCLRVVVEIGCGWLALGRSSRCQLGQSFVQLAIGAAYVDRQRLIIVDADGRRLGVNGHEPLKEPVVDQVAGHAGEAARLDVAGDHQRPVRHIDVPAADTIDPLRATIEAFEPLTAGRCAVRRVAPEAAEKAGQFVCDDDELCVAVAGIGEDLRGGFDRGV